VSTCPYQPKLRTHPAGEPWDGAPHVWPRPTTRYEGEAPRPCQFISAVPDDFFDCDAVRIQICHEEFRCTVCADEISTVRDQTGWLLGDKIIAGACCTRCAYLSVHACPSLASSELAVFKVMSRAGYVWRDEIPGDRLAESSGAVIPTELALPSSLSELRAAAVEVRREPVVG
jgi:hypothetical protein